MKRALLLVVVIAFGHGRAVAAPDVRVEVDDAGAAPKRQLRLTPKVGLTRTVALRTRMSIALSMGGEAMPPQAIPETTITMELRVVDVTRTGDIAFEFTIKKADVDPAGVPAAVTAMKAVLAKMIGLTGKTVITSTGHSRSADIALPASAKSDPQLVEMVDSIKQNVQQLSVPLPDVAVGVGAKWRVKSEFNMNGMKLAQTAAFTLVDVKGDLVKATVKIEQKAANQKIVKGGQTVDLISADGSGTGDQVIDLNGLGPTTANASISSKAAMKAAGMAMEVKLAMEMNLQTK